MISESKFRDSECSQARGLAVSSEDSNVSIKKSEFTRLSSVIGAAVFASELETGISPKQLRITDCSFTEMTASSSGGSLYVQDTDAIISNSTFTESSAEDIGGAIVLSCKSRRA
jgi:hypothetical protein